MKPDQSGGLKEDKRADLHLRVVSESAEFGTLAGEWEALSKACHDSDFFVSWLWLHTWWTHFGRRSELRLYTVRDSSGTLRGILPCYLAPRRALWWVDYYELRFLGAGEDMPSRYLDLIARAKDRGQVTSVIIPNLIAESAVWDVLLLDFMPAESPLTRRMPSEMPEYIHAGERSRTGIIELPPQWRFYLDMLDVEEQKEVQFCRERFSFEQDIRYINPSTQDDVRRTVLAFLALNHQHEKSGQRMNEVESDFVRDLCDLLHNRESLSIHALARGEQCLAVLICYVWNGTVYAAHIAFDPMMERLDPQRLLASLAIEDAIESGAERFDLLQTMPSLSARMATQARETVSLRAYRENQAGRTAHRLRSVSSWLRRRS